MTLTISDTLISSDRTDHSAEPWPVPKSEEPATLWRVSWLPDQYLDHNQAITAMILAEVVSVGLEPCDRRWLNVDGWAAELGLRVPVAVARISKPAQELGRAGRTAETSEPCHGRLRIRGGTTSGGFAGDHEAEPEAE
jgi:hypothetical protein